MPTNSAANPQLSCCECHAVAFVVVCMFVACVPMFAIRLWLRLWLWLERCTERTPGRQAEERQAQTGSATRTPSQGCAYGEGGGWGGGDLVDPAPPGQTTPPPNTKEIFLWGKMKI